MSNDFKDLKNRTADFGGKEDKDGIIRCDACPVLCRIRPGKDGACSRYANDNGVLVRCDNLLLTQRVVEQQGPLVPFSKNEWDGSALRPADTFVTGVGAGTTYPDYKPAPFIVSAKHDNVDTVTVVTEGIFSYCGVKIKIDTDRHLGTETSAVYCQGVQVGHVTTAEYGSQMLALGGVRHLTDATHKNGRIACETLLSLCNKQAVDLQIEDGSQVIVQAGQAPIVNGVQEQRMRVGCGSATIGIFAQQWYGNVDEVIVIDDHITGQLSEHQAGKCLGIPATGIRLNGHKSTPGRYFRVANPGTGWGGTDISDPLSVLKTINPDVAWPGMRILLTSTTGEDALYCVLDEYLKPLEAEMPTAVAQVVDRIGENCEPSLSSVLFMAGAGGSLRAGVTRNPIYLTRSVAKGQSRVTMGGAPVYIYPGGGITVMTDVMRMPDNSFGYVPTPALVAPFEFTMPLSLYQQMEGHMDDVIPVEEVITQLSNEARIENWSEDNPWPFKTATSHDGGSDERS